MNMTWEAMLAFCLLTAVLAMVLRQYRPEYAVLLTIGCGVVLFAAMLGQLSAVRETLDAALSRAELPSGLTETVFKGLGICVLGEYTAQLCRDAGEGAIALKAELAGKIALLILALPMFLDLLRLAAALLSVSS